MSETHHARVPKPFNAAEVVGSLKPREVAP